MGILYFDITSLIIQIVLFTSLFFRGMVKGRSNRIFAVLMVEITLTIIIDICAESFSIWIPATPANTGIRTVFYYLYFLLRNITPLIYQLFMFAVTDTWHILKKNKILQGFLVIPYSITCLALFTNPIHHKVFFIDENLLYNRGSLIYVLYATSLFYFICGIVFLIHFKNLLTIDKFISLICMYPLNLLAVLIQFFFPQLLVEMFMTTLTMLLITLVIQRAEETINPVLGEQSSISYAADIKKALYLKKPITIAFIKIKNYQAMLSVLEYDACNSLLKKIAALIKSRSSEEHLPADLYYLENGLFALITEKMEGAVSLNVPLRVSVECGKSWGEFH